MILWSSVSFGNCKIFTLSENLLNKDYELKSLFIDKGYSFTSDLNEAGFDFYYYSECVNEQYSGGFNGTMSCKSLRVKSILTKNADQNKGIVGVGTHNPLLWTKPLEGKALKTSISKLPNCSDYSINSSGSNVIKQEDSLSKAVVGFNQGKLPSVDDLKIGSEFKCSNFSIDNMKDGNKQGRAELLFKAKEDGSYRNEGKFAVDSFKFNEQSEFEGTMKLNDNLNRALVRSGDNGELFVELSQKSNKDNNSVLRGTLYSICRLAK